MTDPMQAPDELFASIPDDADPATKLYMRAQVVIQAAFHALGDRTDAATEAALGQRELEEILAAALGMLVAADDSLQTKRDIRLRSENHAKYVRTFADIMRETGDKPAAQVLQLLGLRRSAPN